MTNEVSASVEDFFSRFEDEEVGDVSGSLPDEENSEGDDVSDTTKPADEVDEKDDDASDDSKSDADKETPFHEHPRWQQKLKENKELKEREAKREEEFNKLQEKLDKLENKPLSDEEIENMSPKEAMEYARKEAEREFQRDKLVSEKEKQEAERYIEDTLSELRDEGAEFDENKLLKVAEDYTDGNLKKAFDLYQKLEATKSEGAIQAEKEAAKKKAAQSQTGNKGSSKVSGYVRGTSWDSLDLK